MMVFNGLKWNDILGSRRIQDAFLIKISQVNHILFYVAPNSVNFLKLIAHDFLGQRIMYDGIIRLENN